MAAKDRVLVLILLFCFLGTIAFAGDNGRLLNELIDQLKGNSCVYQIQGNTCVKRNPFASFFQRSPKENCVIDAAKALGLMGPQAKSSVPDLIEALNKYHNVDSGDGIIPVRSEIALALGRIGEPSAIRPLIDILFSDDLVMLSESASVSRGYELIGKTSYGAVLDALGMFGVQAREAVVYINPLLKYSGKNYYVRYIPSQAAKALGQIKAVESIPALVEALNNPDCFAEAAQALGEFGPQAIEALPALKELLAVRQNELKIYELGEIKDAINKISR